MKQRQHLPLIILLVIFIILMGFPQSWRNQLYFHLEHFTQGEYWRFLSGHFVHYSWLHCLSNVIGLLLLMSIFNNTYKKLNWWLATLFVATFISSALLFQSSQLNWYMGFSGVLAGLFTYAAVKTYQEHVRLSLVIIISLSMYVFLKLQEGELVRSYIISEVKASSYAHAYGLLAGFIYGTLEQILTCSKRR